MRSNASPAAICSLASRRWISETTPAHWRAKAALLPTRPPPPMMLTFILVRRLRVKAFRTWLFQPPRNLARRRSSAGGGHDLVGDRLDEDLDVLLAIVAGRQRVNRLLHRR